MNVDARLKEDAPDLAHSQRRAAALRGNVLTRAVQAGAPSSSRLVLTRRPGWVLAGAMAAVAAGALALGPALVYDSDTYSANALTPLARAAQSTVSPPLSGGRVLHRVEDYTSVDDRTGAVQKMRWEVWTLNDGTFYRRVTVGGKSTEVVHSDSISSSDVSPQQVASLPTEPAALLDAVENLPQAVVVTQSRQQAARDILGAIIFGGYAPTEVWAAAIEAYGSLENVQVRVDEAAGITYVTDIVKGGPLTLRFDSATARLLGYDSHSPQDGGRTETMRVRVSKVEQQVPADIAEVAKPF